MLAVQEIFKHYEGCPLLKGVSFEVAEGETLCLLGTSGSGKSTLLRIIAGLEQAELGRVLWNGEDLAHIPVHRRHFGLMFQDYALFPHRTVEQNVAFGLRMQGLSVVEIQQRVKEMLEKVNMLSFAKRRVTDLSGGEQQRVALARALAPRPRLLMLDEPLGALDRALRTQLIAELRYLLRESKIPAIYVTHDQDEAFEIADRVALLHNGKIVQSGTPAEVYTNPASIWVAEFLGLSNLMLGKVLSLCPLQVKTDFGCWEVGCKAPEGLQIGDRLAILLRPWGASVQTEPGTENVLSGKVVDVVFRGEGYRLVLQCGEVKFQFYCEKPLGVGEMIRLYIPPESVICLNEPSI